jgi:hypothetical protein
VYPAEPALQYALPAPVFFSSKGLNLKRSVAWIHASTRDLKGLQPGKIPFASFLNDSVTVTCVNMFGNRINLNPKRAQDVEDVLKHA